MAQVTTGVARGATPSLRRRGRSIEQRRARIAYGFIAPALILLILTSIIPIVVALALSFMRYDLLSPPDWVGTDNYRTILTGGQFFDDMGRTLYFTLAQVPIGTVIALLAAVLLNQKIAGSQFIRTTVYLPQAASYVVVALIWVFLYDPVNGPINIILNRLGFGPYYWLTDSALAMPSLVIMSIWRNLGYYMLIFLAALQDIPRDLMEAAELDGATPTQKFLHVTLPLLRPIVGFVVVTWAIGALQMFNQAYVMTGGGPIEATTTVVYRIYTDAFLFLKFGEASATSFIFFVIVGLITLASRRFIAQGVEH